MAGTKTGIGGFEVDGKNYTFDPTEPGTEGAPPVDVTTVENDVQVDDSVRDLSDTTKEVLGDYVHDLTDENYYGVDGPTSPPTDTPITTDDGVPNPPAIGGHSNSEQFGNQFDGPEHGLNLPVQPPAQITLGDRFGPRVQDPAEELLPSKGAFSRGKASPQNPNGNEALPGVGRDSTESPVIGTYVKKVLANNRFNQASTSTGAAVVGLAVNLDSPSRGYNPTLRHPRYGAVSHHRLAQIGTALSLRASRELNATSPGNNPNSAGAEAGAMLPTTNQLALTKVPLKNLEVSDILETLTDDGIDSSQLKSITDGINDGSWGSLTNVHDQWTGITALGMIALSIALVAGVVVVFGVLDVIIGLMASDGKISPMTPEGKFTLGRFTISPNVGPINAASAASDLLSLDIAALLGVRQTTFPFSQALEVGTMAFFGIEGDSFTDLASMEGLDAAVTNPGWNAIVARTIVRSSTEIINAFANIGGNPVSIIKGILNIIEVLRSSKLIAAMNVFANLGDQVLTIKEKHRFDDLGGQIKYSMVDSLSDNVIASAVTKNRLKNSLKLAWSNNRAPSSYLIPDGLYTLAAVTRNLGSISTGLDTMDPAGKTFVHVLENSAKTTGGRIPYDDDGEGVTVVKLEKLLEGEYMPFYFHDLRTNEIISFHAFITALTDDFSPSWEKSDGFGRVDQVRVYKNTQRTISLSFVIASTSDHDFLDMWTKINKLVTLVYPQYTPGRLLMSEDGNYQFTQPFSQLIGASPLIRMRLGDLIRSNGSRFALARLFGADSGLLKLDGSPIDFFGGAKALKDLTKLVTDHTSLGGPDSFDDTLRWVTSHSKIPRFKEKSSSPSPPSPGPPPEPEGADVFDPNPNHLPFLQLKVVATTWSARAFVVEVELPDVQDLIEGYGMDPKSAGNLWADLVESYGSGASVDEKLIGVQYIAPRNTLILSPSAKKKFLDRAVADATANADLLSDFLDVEKNALVKSFRAAGGKGLAGTIESLSFDFFENVTWQISPGQRAPQFMRVNMTFSPVHDISPGLDHNGYNRGPVYPVGYQRPSEDMGKKK